MTPGHDATSAQRSVDAATAGVDSRHRESRRFGYSWTLPAGWEFVDPGLFWHFNPVPAVDVYAAQPSPDGPFVLMIATDVIHIVPGKHAGDDPKDYDRLEKYAAETLRGIDAQIVSTKRVQMFGLKTVEVIGEQEELRATIRLLYRGYRKFEFRCYCLRKRLEAQCEDALSTFRIEELPEPPTEQEVPRVRHLREARLGVAFDAPDDSWLSLGPHFAYGGAQVVWTWSKSGRQIDIQTIDLAAMPSLPDQTFFAAQMARRARASGQRVVENQVVFAGRLWDHHEMTSKDHGAQDLFILIEHDVIYGILVTQPTRDPRLIESAKRGFQLIPKSTSSP
jgi:hypothetical protein